MRVVVAMSGGVDSSAVAALLVEAGHEVVGLAMKTHASNGEASNRACCTPDDMRDARAVADQLGIPFYVMDYEDVFAHTVVQPFAEAYVSGHTPNPCVVCNEKVKFEPMLKRAMAMGADALATGHYAQIVSADADPLSNQIPDLASLAHPKGPWLLARGVDAGKDQSYFLHRMHQHQLEFLRFPLGHLDKSQVRAHAARLGLAVAQKSESQEICFVGKGGYAATVEKILGRGGKAGHFVDTKGRVLGQHQGVHHFTLGQRRGIGIAASEPLYVIGIDALRGLVFLGGKKELLVPQVEVAQMHWLVAPPAEDEVITVQQRYREPPKPATVHKLKDGRWALRFVEVAPSGAPGQSAVVYRGHTVLGGGILAGVSPAAKRSLPVVLQESPKVAYA